MAGVRLVVYLDGKERSVMKVIPYLSIYFFLIAISLHNSNRMKNEISPLVLRRLQFRNLNEIMNYDINVYTC
jgi:hypothetical protein